MVKLYFEGNSTIPREPILLDGDLMQTNPIRNLDSKFTTEDYKKGIENFFKAMRRANEAGMPIEFIVPNEWVDNKTLLKPNGGKQKTKTLQSKNPHNNQK